MEANTARYNNELRRARENSSTSFGQIGKSASKAALVVGTALVAMGAASVKTAMSFETAMAEVNKTADFVTEDGLGNLRKELEDLSKVMPLAFEELADIAASGGQMGIAGENLAQFTETIAKMGIAFDISAGQAAESMGFIASAYQVPIEKLGEVGDAINQVSNSSGATADKTIDFMLRTGAAANNMNIAAEATAAMGAAIIDAGGSVEKSGTAVSGMLLDMANPEWLKDNANLFKEMGVSTTEFANLVKTDGLAAFNLFRDGIISTDDPMTALRDSFGAAAPHVQKLFDETSKFVPLLDAVGQGAEGAATHIGSLDNEYRIMADTQENAFVLMQNSARLVAASFGEALLPAVREITDALIPMIQKVAEWTKANPELVKQIFIVGGALSGTVLGLKLLVDGFTAAKNTFDGLKLAFGAVKAGFALLTGGIGLPLLAIGALIAAGVLLYQNWDLVKEKASQLNEWIKEKFGSLPEPLQQAGRDIAEIFKFIWNTGREYLTLMSELYSGTFESFKTIATGAFQVVWSVVKVSFSGIVNTVSSALQIVATVFSTGFALVKNTVTTVLGVIKAVITGDFKAIPGIIGNGLKTAASIVGNMMGNILNIIKNAGKKLYSIGRDFIQGFYNGIKSMASGVASAASTMVGNAIAAVKKRQDSASPSKVTTKLGGDFAQGMANGINKGRKAVVTEAQKMAADAVKAVQDGVANLKREIALFGDDSALAALKYDISVGKFGAADTSQLIALTQTKEQLELTKKLADANRSVQDSIDGLIKQQALFGNSSSLAALMYDIEHTEKYKGINEELLEVLKEQTRAYEQLGMTAKATDAIRARFAILEKDREKSSEALKGMLGGIEQETPLGKIQSDYEQRLGIVRQFEQLHTDEVQRASEARMAVEQSYQDAKRNLMLTQGEALFGDLAGMAKSFAGEQSGIYRALFAVEKGFAIAQSAMAIQQSVAKAMAVGFPQNIPIIGQAVMQGAEIVSNIKSISMPVGQAHDGIASVPREGTWVLDKNERVVKADDNKKLSRFLDNSEGSKPNINVNVTVSMDGNSSVESNSAYGKQVGQGIAAVVVSEVRKMMRPNGEMDRRYAKR